ncbi:MAG: DUF5713 family protein [Neisseria sp.]|nr:DUF5713 family protein [Neisseria sp.]
MMRHPLKNPDLAGYTFLKVMYDDDYFPPELVRKGEDILVELCRKIEADPPQDLDGLYLLTHEATERFNDLAEDFDEAESEIETVARDTIATDMKYIAEVYGFDHADIEELVAPREW